MRKLWTELSAELHWVTFWLVVMLIALLAQTAGGTH